MDATTWSVRRYRRENRDATPFWNGTSRLLFIGLFFGMLALVGFSVGLLVACGGEDVAVTLGSMPSTLA